MRNRQRFIDARGKPKFRFVHNRQYYGRWCLLVDGHAMHYGGERGQHRTVTCECGFKEEAYGNMIDIAAHHLKGVTP